MARVIQTILIALALGLPTRPGFTVTDWSRATQEDIAAHAAARRLFIAQHSDAGHATADKVVQQPQLDGNQADFDVLHYAIHVNPNFSTESIVAAVDYRVKSLVAALNRVDLNLRSELIVDSAKAGTTSLTFTHIANLLSVNLPAAYSTNQEVSLSVYYHGVPYYDGSAGLRFSSQFGTDLCWTKATPFRSRYWWPCKDFPEDKADSLDLYLEMPDTYDVATNGLRLSQTNLGGGRKLEHWKHRYPICTYNVAFCISQYSKQISDWVYDTDTIPFYCYSLPGNGIALSNFCFYGPQALTALSDRFGVYPFMNEKMGHADFGWTGAMEHQTFCMYATNFHDEWVIAHESGHQWWGDMITCRTFNHIWLNEGFATYSEPLYFEATQGTAAYHNYMQTLRYTGAGSIYVEILTPAEIYNSSLSYDKGAWVLHMLRGVYGDSAFFRGIRDFGNSGFRYGAATTEDFIDEFSASVGEDVSWFINEWIYGEGCPHYRFAFDCRSNDTGWFDFTMWIEQIQSYPTTFSMPIRMRLTSASGSRDTSVWNDGRFAMYQTVVHDSITQVQLDPQQWILRDVTQVPFGIKVVTRTLPEGELGVPYSTTLSAVGGEPPYQWQFFGGDLPFGTVFDPQTATVSGIPSFVADFYFTIVCLDSNLPPNSDTIGFVIRVNPAPGLCGDADGSVSISIADAVFLITYIFGGGPAPEPATTGDADCSGALSIADAVYLITYIFAGGPAPCAACP